MSSVESFIYLNSLGNRLIFRAYISLGSGKRFCFRVGNLGVRKRQTPQSVCAVITKKLCGAGKLGTVVFPTITPVGSDSKFAIPKGSLAQKLDIPVSIFLEHLRRIGNEPLYLQSSSLSINMKIIITELSDSLPLDLP